MITALSIAGTDSSAGAGLFADLATFAALGVRGLGAVTAVTAQNPGAVSRVLVLGAEMVAAQIDAVAGSAPAATKTGMLGTAEVVDAVADAAARRGLHPLVVDPVLVASSGAALLDPAGVTALRDRLLAAADLVTPNLAEAAVLAGWDAPPSDREAMVAVARAVLGLGPGAVLVTGGHLGGDDSPDVLVRRTRGSDVTWFGHARLPGPSPHGTGCVLSAAVTAALARGAALDEAVASAKDFVTRAIAGAARANGELRPCGSCPP